MTQFFYTVWLTLGLITFWLKPEKHLKNSERIQHFLFCLLVGPVLLHTVILDLKKNKDNEKNKDGQ
jgi:hypothetical protein